MGPISGEDYTLGLLVALNILLIAYGLVGGICEWWDARDKETTCEEI